MNRSPAFEVGLIVAAIAATLMAASPLIRVLSQVGFLDVGYFLNREVAPRVGIVAVVLGAAVILRTRHPRWSWAILTAAPILVFGGGLLIMALF